MQKMQNKKFKAVLFDKDGVLIDSVDTCLTAFNKMLTHYNKPPITKEFFVKHFWGVRGPKNIEVMFGDLPKEKIEEIYEYYRKRRMELEHNSKLYPSAINVLNALKGKYKIGLVTNTRREVLSKLLDDFKIGKYFDVTVGGDEAEPKPSPDPIIKACEMLGVKPAETLYIGDTPTDIQAGKAAGCTTAIITTSMRREELAGVEGITVIDDLEELKEILGIT